MKKLWKERAPIYIVPCEAKDAMLMGSGTGNHPQEDLANFGYIL
jgi:hypothetical protein